MFFKFKDYASGNDIIINSDFIEAIEERKTPPYLYQGRAYMDHCTIIWMNHAAPEAPDETAFYTVQETIDDIAPMLLKYVPIELNKGVRTKWTF